MSFFTLESNDGIARAGTVHTPHGNFDTPAFMPVATKASVKALDPRDLVNIGTSIVLANNYHLYLRPGVDTIAQLGGLHAFMSWDGPILTDSGGFQGFSLRHLRKITPDAIIFTSHIDGSNHKFTPESAIRYQEYLGADIIMPLDICVSAGANRREVEESVKLTENWAARSLDSHTRRDQSLFGIVQGGMIPELREVSVAGITSMRFPGYAIGGLSVGESKSEMYRITSLTANMLPIHSPRYLMGVGSPEDLVECVASGIDMFDCVLPTRIARNGSLLVRDGRLNVDKAPYRDRDVPIEDGCDCYTCETFSAAYVHHLFRTKELLAYRLATIHNLRFILRLMKELRSSILTGNFESYRKDFHERFVPPDQNDRRIQKQKWVDSQRCKI